MADADGGDPGEQRRSLDDLSKDELLRFIRKLRDSHNTLKTELAERFYLLTPAHTPFHHPPHLIIPPLLLQPVSFLSLS